MNDFISVIVPNYNYGRFLNKRLNTILNQTFQNFEVIIVDDASTDNSTNILKQYSKHPKVSSILINKKNKGVFASWNKGIDLAKGNLIWIAEADDWSDLSFLEKTTNILNKNKDVGIVFTNSFKVENEEITGCYEYRFNYSDLFKKNFKKNGKEFVKLCMLKENTIPNTSAVVFRKDIWNKSGKSDETLLLTSDWLQWIKMLKFSDIYYLAEPLNFHRFHKYTQREKITSNHLIFLKEKQQTYYKIYDYFSSNIVRNEIISIEARIIIHQTSYNKGSSFSSHRLFKLFKLIYYSQENSLLVLNEVIKIFIRKYIYIK